jgi:hypothetical protein
MSDTNELEQLRTENEQLRAQVEELKTSLNRERDIPRDKDIPQMRENINWLISERTRLEAQVVQLREALLQASIAPHSETARQLRDAALSTPAPRVFTAEQVLPLAASEIMECAVNNKPIPVIRALATYAEKSNWVQLYHGESSGDYKAHACEWAFIGPVRPPYELAQNALAHARAIGLLEGKP